MASPGGERHLDWEGVFNARDLGGLPAAGGRRTAPGALVRSDSLSRLTAAGWQALLGHGVRTVIDLRNAREREEAPDVAPRPAALETVHAPLDGAEDHGVLGVDRGDARVRDAALLPRSPDAQAAARGGRRQGDRRSRPRAGSRSTASAGATAPGELAMAALALLGVPARRDRRRLRAQRRPPGAGFGPPSASPTRTPALEAFLAERGTTAGAVIETTLASLDLAATLAAGGLTAEDVEALRARLLGSSSKVG